MVGDLRVARRVGVERAGLGGGDCGEAELAAGGVEARGAGENVRFWRRLGTRRGQTKLRLAPSVMRKRSRDSRKSLS